MIENQFIEVIQRLFPVDTVTLKQMFLAGFFSHKTCLIYLVKHRVNELYKSGMNKVDAMQQIADDYNISYDTVVNYVYKCKDVKVL